MSRFLQAALPGIACASMLFTPSCGPPPTTPPFRAERPAAPAHSAAQLDGEVLGVDRVTPADRLASGVRLRLRPRADSPIVVDLAPDWYLDRHGLRFGPSEHVRVEGIRRTSAGSTIIYATRVTQAGRTVELRDPVSGEPLWKPE